MAARISDDWEQMYGHPIYFLETFIRGWTIAMQVKEVGSGASQRQLREKLLEAARRREIDVVLVWRLDRWGRSVTDLLVTLQELEHLGVGFVSLTEALDLTTPAGRAMATLLAAFAAFEREILGERVRAGLAHARQNGKRLGRPATAAIHTDKVRKLSRSGLSKSEVARRLNIGRTSVRRILAAPTKKKWARLFNYAALPKHTVERRLLYGADVFCFRPLCVTRLAAPRCRHISQAPFSAIGRALCDCRRPAGAFGLLSCVPAMSSPGSVDEFALFTLRPPRKILRALRGKAVFVDSFRRSFSSVRLDIESGMRAAVRHVLRLGHTRIGHLGADIDAETFLLRKDAYLDTMRKAGLSSRAGWQAVTSFDLDGASVAARHVLSRREPPTAIVCDSDVLAAGVYKAARAARLRIPEDLSVVGIDDSLIARILDPPLTTVAMASGSV